MEEEFCGRVMYMEEVAKNCAQKAGENFVEELFNEFIRPRLKKIREKPKDCEIILDVWKKILEFHF